MRGTRSPHLLLLGVEKMFLKITSPFSYGDNRYEPAAESIEVFDSELWRFAVQNGYASFALPPRPQLKDVAKVIANKKAAPKRKIKTKVK